MRVVIAETGPVVAAEDLAPLLGVAPRDLPRLMREGRVAAVHERGEGEDAGRFRHGARRVRLTCDEGGHVLSRISHDVPR
jgi:hypothetical protein